MKEQRGITLIALIITIIVMLILTGVTINVAINGGIFDVTEEAKFKTQVRQIQEELEIKKALMLADNNGKVITNYILTLADLSIDAKLKEEYEQKLFIDEYGDLCYKRDSVTAKEEQWLIELGIGTGADFITDVTTYVEESIDEENGNTYDYYKIISKIKEKYPTTALISIGPSGELGALNVYEIEAVIIYNMQQTIAMLESKYTNPENVTITNQIEEEVRASLGEVNEYNADNFISNSTTVADLIKEIDDYLEEHLLSSRNETNILAINGEEKILINSNGVSEYSFPNGETIVMTAEEASAFVYTETVNSALSGVSIINATITGYTGTEKVVKVPFAIIKDNGDVVFVESISANALATTKPVRIELTTTLLDQMARDYEEENKSYKEITTADFIMAIGGTPDESVTYQNTVEEKNEIVIDFFIAMGLIQLGENETVSDYVQLVGTGNDQLMYANLVLPALTLKNIQDEYIEPIDEVIISEGITVLQENVVSGNWISEIYLPKTIKNSETSSEILAGAIVKHIRTRLTRDELYSINKGPDNLLGTTDLHVDDDVEYITD